MASLMEELITTLTEEEKIYQELIPIAQEKTEVIVKNDLLRLQAITDKEQEVVDLITGLERKRMDVVNNIGIVINRDPKELTMKKIAQILKTQPEEQEELSIISDKLRDTVQTLVDINKQNKSLINQSLEMIDFNLNFIQSARMLPGNNYTRGAKQTGDYIPELGIFDAKQ